MLNPLQSMLNLQQSEQSPLGRRSFVWLVLACCTLFWLAQQPNAMEPSNAMVIDWAILLFAAVGFAISVFLPMAIWLFVFTAVIPISTPAEAALMLLSTVPLLFKMKSTVPRLAGLCVAELVFVVSFLAGYEPSYTYLVVQLFSFFCFFTISEIRNSHLNRLLLWALVLAGGCMMTSVMISLVQNPSMVLSSRLAYNEHVRTFSTALSFPMYFLVVVLFSAKKPAIKTLVASLLVLSLGMMWLTYSRGCLLAVGIAILVFWGAASRKMGMKSILAIACLGGIIAGAFTLFEVDQDTLLDSRSYFERLRIYSFYIREVFETGRFMQGFGSGNLARVAPLSDLAYYPHSAILDYFFSFGFMGVMVVGFILVKSWRAAEKSGNPALLGFWVLSVATFIPFGSCENLLFHVLLAMSQGPLFEFARVRNKGAASATRLPEAWAPLEPDMPADAPP